MKKPPGSLPRGVFWGGAVGLHLLFLGWAILFGPARQIVFERDKPKTEVLMRGRELEEVINQVRMNVADQLRDRVALLEAGQHRVADNFETLNAYYQPFESEQRDVAEMRFDEYADLLLDGQATLLKQITEATAKDDFAAAAKVREEQMPRLISALDEVRRGVMLLSEEEQLVQKNAQAEDAMFRGDAALRSASSDFYRMIRRSDEAREQLEAADEDQAEADQYAKALAKANDQLDKAEAELSEANEAHVQVSKAAIRAKDDHEVSSKLSDAVRDAKQRIKQSERSVRRAQGETRRAERFFNRYRDAAEKNRQRAAERQTEIERLDTQMRNNMRLAIETLSTARTLHSELIADVRQAARQSPPSETQPAATEGAK